MAAAAADMVPPVCGRFICGKFSRARLESPAGSHEIGSMQRKCNNRTATNPAVESRGLGDVYKRQVPSRRERTELSGIETPHPEVLIPLRLQSNLNPEKSLTAMAARWPQGAIGSHIEVSREAPY